MVRLGQKLHDIRIKRGLTLDDVSRATKIKVSFLSAIEKGEYGKLPSSAYAQGFVSNYAAFLNMQKRETMALFRREFSEEKSFAVLPEGFAKGKDISSKRLTIYHPFVVIAFICLLLFGYLLYQNRYSLLSPPLQISSPKENANVNQNITVVGTTDPNAVVSVNNNPAVVNNNGEFSKNITLFPGKSSITIRARNRVNKETVVTRTVIVTQ